ncbi:MAG: dTDP-4-dehydrorhamnose 3,5-epimerase [Victivallaceae bacterium]|nr:dTDP-4-dehydrorhamnose 3,5-epimerase [Victivallaceae bacterium]
MNVENTILDGVKVLVPRIFGDNRGYFFEAWNRDIFAQAGIICDFMQDNESKSGFGVARGLHYQAAPYTQAKLVRVIAGAVLDVVVDIRRGSPTFGRHMTVELSDENKKQLFVPRGFAHGFMVLSETAIFAYKCDNKYMPSHERGIDLLAPELGINWPLPPEKIILSDKDRHNPGWGEAEMFDFNTKEYLV